MVKAIRLTVSSLVGRYSVPEDVAARIARLASDKVDVTDEVARSVAGDPGIGGLLASAKLRSAAKSLTTEKLQRVRDALGVGGLAANLVVVEKRTRRTIAFEHELGGGGELPVLAPVMDAVPIKPSDVETLFPVEEVKRLKLIALTSADPTERITAIRQLSLAPGSPRDKGAVLLAALSDDDPQVRLESIKALVPLGLNPDVAHEAKRLVSGTDKQKVAAARGIAELAGSAGQGEASVLLTLVAGTLRADIPGEARRELMLSLARAAPVLARNQGQLAAAVSLAADQVNERPAEVMRQVQRVLAALGAEEPDATADALEAELGRMSDDQPRRQLLGAFSVMPVPGGRRRRLAEMMARELLSAPEPETQCLGIANCLCRWGATAAEVLLGALEQTLRRHKTFVLRILDEIASHPDCPGRMKTAAAEKFLSMLKTELSSARSALLECEILSDIKLPDSLKSEIAGELIAHVHEFGSPRMVDTIENTITKLGVPAIGPLMERVTEGVRDRERVSAARVLGDLVGRLHGRSARRSELAVRALMTCVTQLNRKFPDRNVLAASIGQMCTSGLMPPETVRRVVRGLRVRVGKEPYSFGLLDGLGRLACSPNVELEMRVEVAESLLRLLEVELPEMQSRRYTGGEKTVFIAGAETAAYVDMIPILLDGLRNVCVHGGSVALRARLVEALLQKWRQASSWRLIWGPANTLKLAEVLGEIALAPNAGKETRLEIASELVSGADVLPVLRVLAKLFAADGASVDMGELAARVGRHLLERMAPQSGDRIDMDSTVTGCLGVIGARKKLGPKSDAGRLRTEIAGVLFKALRNGAPGAQEALRRMVQSPAAGRNLKSEIETRLSSS